MPDQFLIVGMGQNCLALETPDFPDSVVKIPINRRLIAGGLSNLWHELQTSYDRSKTKGAKHPMFFSLRNVAFGLDARYAKERHIKVLSLLRRVSKLPSVRKMFAKSYEINLDVKYISQVKHIYKGPALIQEKLRPIEFDDITQPLLDDFLRQNIYELHYELWSQGVGLAATRETWGPINWGVRDDGQIRLFDFSSLTDDRTKVQRAVTKDARNSVVSELLRCCPEIDPKNYDDRLGSKIHEQKLSQVWKSHAAAQVTE